MNTSEEEKWLERFLANTDISRLKDVSVPVTPELALGLIELLEAWRHHVLRIESEIALPDSDRTVWGAWDLVAALTLRSFVSRGMKNIDPDVLEVFRQALDDVDLRFQQFTETDESVTVRHLDDGERPKSEWWWDRVPRVGPIRREVERIQSPS